MGKDSILIRLVFCLALCSCGIELHAQLAKAVQVAYSSQVGIRERTGNNDGKEVEQYLASVGLTKGNPWCAAFVFWSFRQAGVNDVPRTGWSPGWFPEKQTIYKRGGKDNRTPGTADVFGIWFENKKRVAHVGFIDDWPADGSFCLTVEGNTNAAGSRDGDGVYRKRRLKKQIYKVSRWI